MPRELTSRVCASASTPPGAHFTVTGSCSGNLRVPLWSGWGVDMFPPQIQLRMYSQYRSVKRCTREITQDESPTFATSLPLRLLPSPDNTVHPSVTCPAPEPFLVMVSGSAMV